MTPSKQWQNWWPDKQQQKSPYGPYSITVCCSQCQTIKITKLPFMCWSVINHCILQISHSTDQLQQLSNDLETLRVTSQHSLFVVGEREINKFGSVSRLGGAMVDMLHEPQRLFVAVHECHGVLHRNDCQQLYRPATVCYSCHLTTTVFSHSSLSNQIQKFTRFHEMPQPGNPGEHGLNMFFPANHGTEEQGDHLSVKGDMQRFFHKTDEKVFLAAYCIMNPSV